MKKYLSVIMEFISKSIVLQIILLIPRLVLFLFEIMLTYFYETIHKKEIHRKDQENRSLIEEKKRCQEENNRLKEKVFENEVMIKDILRQEKNGKRLLGIHHIQSNQLQYDFTLKEYIKKVHTVYFMLHESADSDTFYVRAHYAGQIRECLNGEKYDSLKNPENKAWIFRIEAAIYKSLGTMQIHQLDTMNEFERLGIATLGLSYLNKIAISHNIKRIHGIMDYSENLPQFYHNRGFNVFYPENPLSNIRFEMQLKYASN